MPSLNEWKKYWDIYQVVEQNPWIRPKAISNVLNMRPTTAGALLKEAVDLGHIVGPQIRKRSFKPFAEHMYFAKFKYPGEMYQKYMEEKDIIFHSIMDGFANFRIVSKKQLDINALMYGLRTDYLISVPPYRDWGSSTIRMRTMINNFNPKEYTPKNYIKAHWHESVEWTELDEILFNEFKYNLRKPVAHVMKKCNINRKVINDWFKKLPLYCTVFTSFFPQTIKEYEPYIYLFETEYEDFVIEVFSELPTTVWFFKVADTLVLYTWLDRGSIGMADYRTPEINTLHTLLMLRDFLKKEIVTKEQHAFVQCYWRKEPEP